MSAALEDFSGSLDCDSSVTLLELVSCGGADPVMELVDKIVHHITSKLQRTTPRTNNWAFMLWH